MAIVELRPLGVKCNIACTYCYQNPQRDAGNVLHDYDLDAMLQAIEAEGGDFALFGGEPLLMPLDDLEKLWAWGLERNGRNSLQTNGALITNRHIEAFKRYRVEVGLSIDGPGELNSARWAGSEERTRETTERIENVIRDLCVEGLAPTLIVTLHRRNAVDDKLDRLCEWLRDMEKSGLSRARLHLLEVDSTEVRNSLALSPDENVTAVRKFAELQGSLERLKLDLFEDQRRMLAGDDDGVTCVWGACDPYTTAAVRGVEGNGQSSNCGRTNKDGIDFPKATSEGFERYLALYHTPQDAGGCQGCRFFLFCKGQCPGTGINGDWRNRSEHCKAWMDTYERSEREALAAGQKPLSLSPLRETLEQHFLSTWEMGKNTTLNHVLQLVAGGNTPPSNKTIVTDQLVTDGRLPFRLPPFLRRNWTSNEAETRWAGRFERLKDVVEEMQWRSVLAGIRECATVRASSHARWRELGLKDAPVGAGRIVVGTEAAVEEFVRAVSAGADDEIVRLLGQPTCCHTARRSTWVEQGWEDPTWPLADATAGERLADNSRIVSIHGSAYSNPFWRPLGLYLNPHQVCRLDCDQAERLSIDVAENARAAGLGEFVDDLEEILHWPVEWTSLHGIAETRTPVLKFIRSTDATRELRVVRFVARNGRYPKEGATGVRFPFQTPNQPLTQLGPSIRRSGAAVAGKQSPDAAASPILAEAFADIERSGVRGMIANVYLTPYFTVLKLQDGRVGAAISYFRQADALSRRLPRVSASDPLWLHWLFRDENPEAVLGGPDMETPSLLRSLRVAVLSALAAPTLASGSGLGCHAADVPPEELFDPEGAAVVIGFGGYLDRWASAPRISSLHVCDLGYATRHAEIETALDSYRGARSGISFSASDGGDFAERLSAANCVAITGSALCNGTMERLLESVRPGAYVVVQGQSSGIPPAPLFRRGVSCVATTIKPLELAQLAAADPTGFNLRADLEGGLSWKYLVSNKTLDQ